MMSTSLTTAPNGGPIRFSPPVRWGLLDFMYAVLLLFFFFLFVLFFLLFASSSSSSQTSSPSSSPDVARCQHGPPDCSGQRRTSIASSRLQWAAPALNSGRQIANRGALERTGQRRAWGSGADWATPGLTRGPPERSGQRRTSAARRYVRRCVRNMSEKNVRKDMSEDMSEEMSENMSEDMSEKNVRKNVRRNVR